MSKTDKIREFLSDDDAMTLLKTIDMLNPMSKSVNECCTIRLVSEVMAKSLRETWSLVNKGIECEVIMSYGGVLSRKRIDLTELGELLTECTTPNEIKEVLKNVEN